jgi:hypothetical protein
MHKGLWWLQQSLRRFMMMFAMPVAAFGLAIAVADTVPRYDVKPTCRAAISMVATGSEGRTVESCLTGEEHARKELEKEWPKVPAAERIQCIATMAKGGAPSYVELIVCLEMMRDSRMHREEEERTKKSQKTSGKR